VGRAGQGVNWYIAEALECALRAVRTGLGVESEGAVATEVLYIGQAFGIESVEGSLSRWCLNGYHVVRLWLSV